MDPLPVHASRFDEGEVQSQARHAEDRARAVDSPPSEGHPSGLTRSTSMRLGQLQSPKSDIEAQARQVEEEQLHEAQTIDRPPDEDQDIRKSKVYRPYNLPVLLILAPASILGVLCRLGLQALTTFEGSSVFALGYVNALGCLIMGFGLSMKGPLGEYYGPFYTALTTGFCGSLTTFSGWQFDIFNSWINAGDHRRSGLSDFVNGIGISTVTLSLSLGSVSFGYTTGLMVLPYLKFPRFPPRWQRYTSSAICALVYGAAIVTYFLLSTSFRSQATAAILFSYPGTLTRYLLSITLNPRFKALPSGTLTANTAGSALLAGFHVLQNLNSPLSPLGKGWLAALETRSFVTSLDMPPTPVQSLPGDGPRAGLEEDQEAALAAAEGDEIMEEADEQEEGYASSTPTSTLTWISWFCSLPGHEYFCEVSEDFIEDDFNLTGLNTMVPFWKEAMEMVLDVEPEDEDASKIPDVSIVESSAEMLYGLVHQRYILTRAGLQAMAEKYENGVFGSCPRVYCVTTNVVPCGRSDMPGVDTVKLYCPNCNDIYVPPSSRFQGVDGAFFGTTFAHLFFQTYRELAPAPFWKAPSAGSSPHSPRGASGGRSAAFINPNQYGGQKPANGYVYVPRIYGFKVSERAKNGPRMQWLRLRPESPEELDMIDWRGRWIDEDDEYDTEEEEEEDRQMEDFDPDAVEGEDDDEEEEEEEEESAMQGQSTHGGRRHVDLSSKVPKSPTSPASSIAPRTPQDRGSPPSFNLDYYCNHFGSLGEGKVKAVRQFQQWSSQGDSWPNATVTEV